MRFPFTEYAEELFVEYRAIQAGQKGGTGCQAGKELYLLAPWHLLIGDKIQVTLY